MYISYRWNAEQCSSCCFGSQVVPGRQGQLSVASPRWPELRVYQRWRQEMISGNDLELTLTNRNSATKKKQKLKSQFLVVFTELRQLKQGDGIKGSSSPGSSYLKIQTTILYSGALSLHNPLDYPGSIQHLIQAHMILLFVLLEDKSWLCFVLSARCILSFLCTFRCFA